MNRLNMTVMHRNGRRFFEIQWRDPVTDKMRTESTKAENRRDAERYAARRLLELESDDDGPRRDTTWTEFIAKLKAEYYPGLAIASQRKISVTLRLAERVVDPGRLAVVRERQVGQIKSKLRTDGRSEYTIRGHLANLRAVLNWAEREKLIPEAPHIEMPPEPPESTRGRAPTGEEFDRMKLATTKVVGRVLSDEWNRLIDGLWLSGLRVGEAHKLHWTEPGITIDTSGRRPLFRIQAGSQKARRFELLPMTPDFATWLFNVPVSDRRGYVFNPLDRLGFRASQEQMGKVISEIGAKAAIKVSDTKFASAHDLRRAFGERWAKRKRAPTLMKLMRHKSLTTTMRFYVDEEAQAVADELWRDDTNTLTNTPVNLAHVNATNNEKHR